MLFFYKNDIIFKRQNVSRKAKIMLDKFKFNVSNYIYQSITNDAFRFGFKENQKINYNRFLNILIKNYYEVSKDKLDIISKKFPDVEKGEIKEIISSSLLFNGIKESIMPKNFTIRPDKESANIFLEIELKELRNITISDYMRLILLEFCSLKIYEKEKIIFKQNYEIIRKSIESKRKMYIVSRNSKFTFDCINVVQSPDDEHNYLVGKSYYDNDISFVSSIKLSTIQSVISLDDEQTILEQDIDLINKNLENGPQFIGAELVNAKVKFTPGGIKMYDKCYNDRPICVAFDEKENIMTFHNTIEHLFIYLKQFGRHALVLYPEELRTKLKDFYIKANEAYK